MGGGQSFRGGSLPAIWDGMDLVLGGRLGASSVGQVSVSVVPDRRKGKRKGEEERMGKDCIFLCTLEC